MDLVRLCLLTRDVAYRESKKHQPRTEGQDVWFSQIKDKKPSMTQLLISLQKLFSHKGFI